MAILTGPDRQRLLADCEQVELRSAEVIWRSGERMRHVYFPIEGIISLVTTLRDGSRLEVGSIGHEGMLGSSLILGVNTSAQHAIVQRPGVAWRLSASRVSAASAEEHHTAPAAELLPVRADGTAGPDDSLFALSPSAGASGTRGCS